jgi:hypothetical protein
VTDAASAPRLTSSSPPRCSDLARDRSDVLAGSALPTHAFLLVEEPGPWGVEPHPTGGLEAAVAAEAHRWARELSARLLLIRRPGRTTGASRTWALADIVAGTLRVGTVSAAADLATVDPTADGELEAAPWYLVCAQGRHDVCCSIRGRPVARRLHELDAVVWECSHVGGDRFAANVLVLPDGLMYGYVDEADADRLVSLRAEGRLLTDHLRGQCGSPPAAQVAEDAVRRIVADDAIRTVVIDSVEHAGRGSWRVRLTYVPSRQPYVVDVEESHIDVEGRLTCAGPSPGRLRTFAVSSITD